MDFLKKNYEKILLGVVLVDRFHWLLYLMGAFLFFTGLKWAVAQGPMAQARDNAVVRAARRLFPVTEGFEGRKFFSRANEG